MLNSRPLNSRPLNAQPRSFSRSIVSFGKVLATKPQKVFAFITSLSNSLVSVRMAISSIVTANQYIVATAERLRGYTRILASGVASLTQIKKMATQRLTVMVMIDVIYAKNVGKYVRSFVYSTMGELQRCSTIFVINFTSVSTNMYKRIWVLVFNMSNVLVDIKKRVSISLISETISNAFAVAFRLGRQFLQELNTSVSMISYATRSIDATIGAVINTIASAKKNINTAIHINFAAVVVVNKVVFVAEQFITSITSITFITTFRKAIRSAISYVDTVTSSNSRLVKVIRCAVAWIGYLWSHATRSRRAAKEIRLDGIMNNTVNLQGIHTIQTRLTGSMQGDVNLVGRYSPDHDMVGKSTPEIKLKGEV